MTNTNRRYVGRQGGREVCIGREITNRNRRQVGRKECR